MLPWRFLTPFIAAVAMLPIASCLGGRSDVEEPGGGRDPGGGYGLGVPKDKPLPAYLTEDGKLKEGYDIIDMRNNSGPVCQVHRVTMLEELQEGREQYRNGSRAWEYETFVEAQGNLFPNAQQAIRTPWDVGNDTYPWEKLVRYCPQCRKVQKRWVGAAWKRIKDMEDSRP